MWLERFMTQADAYQQSGCNLQPIGIKKYETLEMTYCAN